MSFDVAVGRHPPGNRPPELKRPASHRFIGDLEPALGQQFLDVAIAQGEPEVQPGRVLKCLAPEIGPERSAMPARYPTNGSSAPGCRDNAVAGASGLAERETGISREAAGGTFS